MPSSTQRAYDAVYDNVQIISNTKDQYKEIAQQEYILEKVPDYNNLFSELLNHPSTQLRLRNGHKLPKQVEIDFNLRMNSKKTKSKQTCLTTISGINQYKFFMQPLFKIEQNSHSNIHFATATDVDVDVDVGTKKEKVSEIKKKKNYGVQTDFREIECQTEPWEPNYIIPRNNTGNKQLALFKENQCNNEPEVLILKNFEINKKQRPIISEVERIERARDRRHFDASLMHMSDTERMRQSLVREAKDWQERENDMELLQASDIEKFKKYLKKKEERMEERRNNLIENSNKHLKSKLEIKVKKLKRGLNRSLGAIVKNAIVKSNLIKNKKSIVEEFMDPASSVYAPRARDGNIRHYTSDSDLTKLTKSNYLNTFNKVSSELNEYDQTIKNKLKEMQKKGYKDKLEKTLSNDLDVIHKAILNEKNNDFMNKGQCWICPSDNIDIKTRYVKQKLKKRPKTPEVKILEEMMNEKN